MNTPPNNQQPQTPQSTLEWMASNRLYEEYLFFYVIILSVITAIAYYSFGFEIDGWTQPQNLAINFVFYGVLVILLFLTPRWYNVIWGNQARLDKRNKNVLKKIEAIEDATLRQQARQLYENNGDLRPNRKQVIALILLFCFFNFELFFINSWVKGEDYHLVWQPDWVNAIIDWVRSELTLPPLNENRGFFILKFEPDSYILPNKEIEFLALPMANSTLLFHSWRVLIFLPTLMIFSLLFWQPLDWLGINQVSLKHVRTIRRFIYCSIVTPFVLILFFAVSMMATMEVELSLEILLKNGGWVKGLRFLLGYIYILWCFKLLEGWFYFWKNILIKIMR